MSGIEIISFTPKGTALSTSVRHSGNSDAWAVVNFMRRMNGRTTLDKITMFVFGGDESKAKSTISYLKMKGIVVGV